MTLPSSNPSLQAALASANAAPSAAAAGAAASAARAATDAAKKRAARGATDYDAWRALVDTAHLKPLRREAEEEGERERVVGDAPSRGAPPFQLSPHSARPAPRPALTLGADGVPRRR
jgi:hypothetical protein